MPAVSPHMMIDSVDDHDRPVGVIRRDQVFVRHANFRVVHCLVFNRRDQLLLQRIGKENPRHPGLWGSSVAGYIFANETYDQAVTRRLEEELGVREPVAYVGKTSMYDEGCEKFIGVFRAMHDGPIELDHRHIDSVAFVSPEQLHQMIRDRREQFTPTFLRVISYVESGT
jgi:16S rRNA (adenine1518-N6/adenine1519-N6)-dimethyltransferase